MKIHHIALRTHQLAWVLSFYQRIFGFEIKRENPGHSFWLSMGKGESVLMIEQASKNEAPYSHQSLEFLAFSVSSDERLAFKEHLKKEGVILEDESEHTLYFRDPDGRRIGVSSYPLNED
ncbi:VOC family protein [Myxococcota bacterium]|nr:VOC family protein [Myxococcota bacterium]